MAVFRDRISLMYILILLLGLFFLSCGDGSDVGDFVPVSRLDEPTGVLGGSPLIATGARHTCVLLGGGGLRCWGRNDFGQLGNGTTDDSLSPYRVEFGRTRRAVSISAGRDNTCAIRDDGAALCWGRNDFGQLGNGLRDDSYFPMEVSLQRGQRARSISSGYDHSCAILEDDSLVCWGYNSSGELGDGTTVLKVRPVSVKLPKGGWARAVSAGFKHTCAILDDYSAYCWGNNFYGQLGNGGREERHTPVPVKFASEQKVLSVSTGDIHTCALLSDYSLACWGSNLYGRLGDGSTRDSHTPKAVKLLAGRRAKMVAVGDNHSCALLDDDSLACWGHDANGQLGNGGTPEERHTPFPVDMEGMIGATFLDGQYMHLCAFLDDDSLVCWGDNTAGQLGDGSREDRHSPVVIL